MDEAGLNRAPTSDRVNNTRTDTGGARTREVRLQEAVGHGDLGRDPALGKSGLSGVLSERDARSQEAGSEGKMLRSEGKGRKTNLLILGLGNTLLCDDGIGIYLGRLVSALLAEEDDLPGAAPDFVELSLAGLQLLDYISGYERLVIIDAIQTADGAAGQLYTFGEEVLAGTVRLTSVHDINLATALQLGRRLGMKIPSQVLIYAVEAKDVFTFQESCTQELSAAIPELAARISRDIREKLAG
ncbi:Peptidase HybD-like domain protein [Acididesulfobacillus acetoxydans]|uniref:Hydrogenase maturation protease n=1 Tax=Acididesulfobacillus acetoxydans TaxID=1561005 RepID=A0A8S0X3P0_9FIRM|nr:hydrogenase maturation protease [Acididesulfobacillus acetoxydans]CAA7600260.1 Peptidase HybD-like domain protein [Acididesulfobacillus acetoxydans]CEJ09638.1 Hydrogenase maturation protease [Acididesulfobacillus acetoxydans]